MSRLGGLAGLREVSGEVWLYERGYLELCSQPYDESWQPMAHIANLSVESTDRWAPKGTGA